MSKQLGTKPPQRTLSELHFLQQQHQNHPEIARIEQAIGYLKKRKEMIDYPHFRKKQIPIGSGIVESGHKVVMQRRMKQAGMRWAEANLNPMLALRMAVCNKTWTAQWRTMHTQARKKKRQQRLNKIQAPNKLEPAEVITEADNQRLIKLAHKIKTMSKPKHSWKKHDWIFLNRQNPIHKK